MGVFRLISFIVLCGLSVSAYASIDVYEFSDEDNRQQYLALTKELRCPKCQNQDIADSNAPIAQDMRREVHRMVEQGESSESIVAFMVERFGEFVSYKPKVDRTTYALWYGPYVVMAFGIIVVLLLAVRKRAGQRQNTKPEMDIDQKAALNALLEENSKEDQKEDKPSGSDKS